MNLTRKYINSKILFNNFNLNTIIMRINCDFYLIGSVSCRYFFADAVKVFGFQANFVFRVGRVGKIGKSILKYKVGLSVCIK